MAATAATAGTVASATPPAIKVLILRVRAARCLAMPHAFHPHDDEQKVPDHGQARMYTVRPTPAFVAHAMTSSRGHMCVTSTAKVAAIQWSDVAVRTEQSDRPRPRRRLKLAL
ncbi:hypothetical protein MMAGJ_08610 [Mycolicibacterium mageritense]|uniref:Secreted protein n=1 Tax=Mycolicibacterium mageritense TaxID=53462 RepID=A0ABN5Y3L2_MYCME|nr:hypothetical protein MMAGJ_08610 [Mycolicibacterium mageritense]